MDKIYFNHEISKNRSTNCNYINYISGAVHTTYSRPIIKLLLGKIYDTCSTKDFLLTKFTYIYSFFVKVSILFNKVNHALKARKHSYITGHA